MFNCCLLSGLTCSRKNKSLGDLNFKDSYKYCASHEYLYINKCKSGGLQTLSVVL